MHLYQESEGLDTHEAFTSTLTNFAARLTITATFVALALRLQDGWLLAIVTAWGLALLGVLTISLAHQRHARVGRELLRHYAIAAIVITLSRGIGAYVTNHIT